MMKLSQFPGESDPIIMAPEGFIDAKHWSAVSNQRVSIIEFRTLSDIPIFHTIHIDRQNHPHQKEDVK